MRTYEQTHPWLTFRWEPRRLTYPVWLLLGEAAAYIQVIQRAALPPAAAHALEKEALVKGLHALAALEGNSLNEQQVAQGLAGELKLSPSQSYLGQEIQNLFKAVRWTEDRARAGDRQFSPWSLQLLNAQVLKGLPWDEETSPGEYRSERQHQGAHGGAPAEDISYLVERLCEWLHPDRFMPAHAEEASAFGLVRAMLAQLYLLWARPFADGNVRTAWLVTGQLLMEAGAPPFIVYRFAAHTAKARSLWTREIASAGSGHGDPVPFIAFLSRSLKETLSAAAEEVGAEQQHGLLNDHLHHLFKADRSTNGARRQKLLMALTVAQGPVDHGRITRLNPELAATYARLDRKTLLRDVHHLEDQGLLARDAKGLMPASTPLRAFRSLLPG